VVGGAGLGGPGGEVDDLLIGEVGGFDPAGDAVLSSEPGHAAGLRVDLGGGAISGARLALPSATGDHPLLSASGSVVSASCPPGGGDRLDVSGTSAADVTVTEWSKDVVAQVTTVNDETVVGLNGAPAIEGTDVIVLQVDAGTSISTYTLTESFNTSTSACSFTGQVVTTNG